MDVISSFVDRVGGLDKVYISMSGGKDSTVMLDIARRMYPDILAVFLSTGCEYPDIIRFVNECKSGGGKSEGYSPETHPSAGVESIRIPSRFKRNGRTHRKNQIQSKFQSYSNMAQRGFKVQTRPQVEVLAHRALRHSLNMLRETQKRASVAIRERNWPTPHNRCDGERIEAKDKLLSAPRWMQRVRWPYFLSATLHLDRKGYLGLHRAFQSSNRRHIPQRSYENRMCCMSHGSISLG